MDKVTKIIDNLAQIREDICTLYDKEVAEEALEPLNKASVDVLSAIASLNEVVKLKGLGGFYIENAPFTQEKVNKLNNMDSFSTELSKVSSETKIKNNSPVIEKTIDKKFFLVPFSEEVLEEASARTTLTELFGFLRTYTWRKDTGLSVTPLHIKADGNYVNCFIQTVSSERNRCLVYHFNTTRLINTSSWADDLEPISLDSKDTYGYLLTEIVEEEPNVLVNFPYFTTTFYMSLIQTSLSALEDFSNLRNFSLGLYKVSDENYKPYLYVRHNIVEDNIHMSVQNLQEGNEFSLDLKYNKRSKSFVSDTGDKYKLCIYSNFITKKVDPI